MMMYASWNGRVKLICIILEAERAVERWKPHTGPWHVHKYDR